MGAPIIFSGNFAKLLKANLDFGQNQILSGSVVPTLTATLAGPGSLYLNINTGAVYVKQDSGSTTNWKAISVDVAAPVVQLGETVAAGDALYVSQGVADGGRTVGLAYKLDATNDTRIEFLGFAAAAGGLGNSTLVIANGQYATGATYITGKPVFASVTTPGAIQNTPPSTIGHWLLQLGTAISSTFLEINGANSATAIKLTSANAAPLNSVGLTMPAEFSVANSPLTANGTLAVTKANQTATSVYAGPIFGNASAAPSFRKLSATDENGLILHFFGDGSDGNVTISSGTTNLTRDMYYQNLTINGTGKLKSANFKIYVQQNLDLSAAAADAISAPFGNGGNAAAAAGGVAGGTTTVGTVGAGTAGIVGAAGSVAAGVIGGVSSASSPGAGGNSGAGGAGGLGSSGAGGASRAGTATTIPSTIRRVTQELIRGVALITGGTGGPGGSSGGGDTTNSSFGGGGGGSGGMVLFVSACNIIRGAGTAASAISARGGNGGNGGSNAAGTNTGGSGGGGGGGGGWIYLVYCFLSGSTATNMLDVNGGNGGNGGAGKGTGIGGAGATSGQGGRITQFNIDAGTSSETFGAATVAGTAASGITPGVGGVATGGRISL